MNKVDLIKIGTIALLETILVATIIFCASRRSFVYLTAPSAYLGSADEEELDDAPPFRWPDVAETTTPQTNENGTNAPDPLDSDDFWSFDDADASKVDSFDVETPDADAPEVETFGPETFGPETPDADAPEVETSENAIWNDGGFPGQAKNLTCLGGQKYTFRWRPPGEFLMGSPTKEKGRDSDEQQH